MLNDVKQKYLNFVESYYSLLPAVENYSEQLKAIKKDEKPFNLKEYLKKLIDENEVKYNYKTFQKKLEKFGETIGFEGTSKLSNFLKENYGIVFEDTKTFGINFVASIHTYTMTLTSCFKLVLKDVTEENYNDFLNNALKISIDTYHKTLSQYGIDLSFGDSLFKKCSLVNKCIKSYTDIKVLIDQSNKGEYLDSFFKSLNDVVQCYSVVNDLKHGENPIKNIYEYETILKLREMLIQIINIFNQFPDEINVYYKNLLKIIKADVENYLKSDDFQSYVNNYYSDVYDQKVASLEPKIASDSNYINPKIIKLLEKNYVLALKFYKKDKLEKFISTKCLFNIEINTLKKHLTSFEDFKSIYIFATAYKIVGEKYEKEIDEIVNKHLAQLNDQKFEEIKKQKYNTIDKLLTENLLLFYYGVGVNFLELVVEFAKDDLDNEYDELPNELKNLKIVSIIKKYFDLKRADSIKEAINLYFSELQSQKQHDEIVKIQNDQFNLKQIIENKKLFNQNKYYEESLKIQKANNELIASKIDELIKTKKDATKKIINYFDYYIK